MDAIGFTQKYSSLSNAKEVNSLAEVTRIDNKKFIVYQHGQRWHSRLACWVKDSVRSFFSPLRKNTPNTVWEQLSYDLGSDASIQNKSRQLAQTKIERWQKKGVPLRILHLRQLLRQLDEDFDSRAVAVAVSLPYKNTSPADGNRLDVTILPTPQEWGTGDRGFMDTTQSENRDFW